MSDSREIARSALGARVVLSADNKELTVHCNCGETYRADQLITPPSTAECPSCGYELECTEPEQRARFVVAGAGFNTCGPMSDDGKPPKDFK